LCQPSSKTLQTEIRCSRITAVFDENDLNLLYIVFCNALAGVAIEAGGDPILRGNRIHDGNQEGVYAWNERTTTLENNDIAGNGFAGIAIRNGSNLIIKGNRIRDGQREGVFVENAEGTLEENNIYGNAFDGVEQRPRGEFPNDTQVESCLAIRDRRHQAAPLPDRR